MVEVEVYLARIGYSGSLTPDVETLRNICRAHLFTVPFENLDISWGAKFLSIRKHSSAKSWSTSW
jgi:arylamine N-acetyltransferase